jgi:hypothetical protein
MVSSSWEAGNHGAVERLAVDRHDGAVAADLARNDVEAVAGGAVKKATGIGLALAGDEGRHFLVEDADAAMAIKRNARGIALDRIAAQVADEFRPLVFSGDDFARALPFASHGFEEDRILVTGDRGRGGGEDDCRKTKRDDAKLGEHGHTCCGWKRDLKVTQNG